MRVPLYKPLFTQRYSNKILIRCFGGRHRIRNTSIKSLNFFIMTISEIDIEQPRKTTDFVSPETMSCFHCADVTRNPGQ